MIKPLPMTHPLSKHWEQPPLEAIRFTDVRALMTAATFEELKTYSHTLPTGVYDGKMWKNCSDLLPVLCWYGPSEDPEKCSINCLTIYLIDQPYVYEST